MRIETAVELRDAVLAALPEADAVIMAAAVADYRPAEAAGLKLKKEQTGGELTLRLVENPDVLRAVVAETPTWTSEQQERVAGALDVLWNLPSYERLVDAWGLDGDQATSTVLWVIDLVTAAIRDGNAPPGSSA